MDFDVNLVSALKVRKHVMVFQIAEVQKTRNSHIARNSRQRVKNLKTAVTPPNHNIAFQTIYYFIFPACSKWEIKCANGKCVSKKAFCNAINDCGDGSDEPANCSCKEYLKLTEPSKVCDGVVHCGDNTDERFCTCDGSNFKCGRLKGKMCIL